jgi:hypothetical protein
MSRRDDQNAAAYEQPENREPVGPGVRRAPARRMAHHVPVRFPEETINAIKSLADEDGVTVSVWIRRVIGEEVERRTRSASSTESSAALRDLMDALRFSVQERNSTESEEATRGSTDRNLTQLAG